MTNDNGVEKKERLPAAGDPEDRRGDEAALLAIIVNSSPLAIIAIDNDDCVRVWNPAAERMFGWTEEETLGKPLPIIYEEKKEEFGEIAAAARKGERVVIKRTRRQRKDDVIIDVSLSMSPMTDAQGRTVGRVGIIAEITEHLRREDRLRESEEKYRIILDNMEEGYHEVDLRGSFTLWNRSFARIMGRDDEELLGMNYRQYAADEEQRRRVLAAYNQVFATGAPLDSFTWDIVRKDGERRTVEVSASLIRGGNQQPTGFRGIVRDVTERKQTEDKLCQAEARYRSIFENAQESIYRATPEGRIIMANQAMAAMLGYESPEELMAEVTDIGRQLYVHPEEREEIDRAMEEHGAVKNYEARLYRRDGSALWVSMTMQAIRDAGGKILYYEGIDTDITERRQSVERLHKALGATIQAISSVVETRDPYTAGHQRRVAHLSRAIAREMGLDGKRIEGLLMAATIHDIGKISVPAEILSMPRRLTDIEFGLIKIHSQSGHDILKDIEFPWPIARIILEHHERMDGSGYPGGLRGDRLLRESRILAVADVVESMASHRPYRASLGIDAALSEITLHRGMLYDPEAVDACLSLFREGGYRMD